MLLLLQELSEEIEDYTQRFNTEDQLEWSLVLQEVAAFVEVTGLSACTSKPGHAPSSTRTLSDWFWPRLIRWWL